MKGLWIKDCKIMKTQKKFFGMVILLAGVIAVMTRDATFIVGYLTMFGSMFTISTINYDEYDNGAVFLLSLPVSRKDYILEKYGFALFMGLGAWVISTVIMTVTGWIRMAPLSGNTIVSSLFILPVAFVLLSVMLPLQLKFGADRSRIVILCAVGISFILATFLRRFEVQMAGGLDTIFDLIKKLDEWTAGVLTIGITGIILYISYRISLHIMEKKEF